MSLRGLSDFTYVNKVPQRTYFIRKNGTKFSAESNPGYTSTDLNTDPEVNVTLGDYLGTFRGIKMKARQATFTYNSSPTQPVSIGTLNHNLGDIVFLGMEISCVVDNLGTVMVSTHLCGHFVDNNAIGDPVNFSCSVMLDANATTTDVFLDVTEVIARTRTVTIYYALR